MPRKQSHAKICLSLFFLLLTLGLAGCANYASRIRGPRWDFESGRPESAIEELKKLVGMHDKDELLYLMDLGLVYHSSKKYPEAIQTFLAAEKIASLNDYTSVSQEVGSVIFSDETKVYKGEDFEKILINVYLAIDYTLLGKFDDALVECRKVNHKLDLMISEGNLPYEHNHFAKYLAAALFEARHEYNDAFVDYRTLRKWKSDLAYLPVPLLRMADKLKALEELAAYKKAYPEVKKYRMEKGEGEVMLVLEQGKAPYKVPHPQFQLMPMFVRNSYDSRSGFLRDASGKYSSETKMLFDIENTAIQELQHRIGKIIAKKVGGTVAKGAIAVGVGELTKSKELGWLTFLLLHASDSADLRSWTTLPAHLQIARLTLPAGRHEILLDMVEAGTTVKGVQRWQNVEVRPGTITFLNYRMMH